MIKLKDILNEALNIYSVSVTIISDKDANFTDILDGMRATRKVTIINSTHDPEMFDAVDNHIQISIKRWGTIVS